MEQIYYTIEIGAFEIGSEYPCYWMDALSGKEFSRLEDATREASELGCSWWRVVEHVKTSRVVEKSQRYSECSV